jgi:hypothetical protein
MSSNIQIEDYMRKNFKGHFLGCFNADDLPNNPPPSSNLIANYSDKNDGDGGTHWVAMINLNSDNGEPTLFFDSYGGDADFEDVVLNKKTNFKNYMNRHSGGSYGHNNINIQSRDGDSCGHYAVHAIMTQSIPSLTGQKRSANTAWKDYTSSFNTPEENDKLIKEKIKLTNEKPEVIEKPKPIKKFDGSGIKVVGGKLSVKHLKALLNASYEEKPPTRIDDFILDSKLSTKHVKVYHNPKTLQTVIAHRGTKEWYDWGNNLIYGLFGKTGYKLTPRFKESQRVHNATVAKYGLKHLSTISHSQGGIASEILGQEGKEIITLNKATRPFANVKGKKQYDISTTLDPVSKLNPFQRKSKKDISIKSKSYNPIKEHLLPVLEGLDEDTEIGEGQRKRICMKKTDLIKEHKELIPILKSGSKKERMKEGRKQERELREYL